MSGCGDTGRCCDGPTCETSKGKCSCEVCSGRTWRYDNDCTPGACWTQEDGVYTCIQKNPCECEYIGGEFGGAGIKCPDDPEGPKPPPPAPPTPPDPGPVYRWVCYRGIGCGAVEWICDPDVPPEKCYWSERECNARCSVSPPPPPPPPDNPCENDANCQSGVCCDGDCCPEGQNCCNGSCCDGFCCDGACQPDECAGPCQPDGICFPTAGDAQDYANLFLEVREVCEIVPATDEFVGCTGPGAWILYWRPVQNPLP